jgi:hypothetical protein
MELPNSYQKDEYENSHGALFNYIYDLLKERILSINSNVRKWRGESKNERNKRINVIKCLYNLLLFYRIIFGNIISWLTSLY